MFWIKKSSKLCRLPARRILTEAVEGLVSVVLPVYNGGGYLAESIASVLAQTYSQWELIVIDDGSTDGSGAVAEDYARQDPRIRVYRQENQKLPRTLNRGFSMARGEFYTWTSADNRMLPDFLERLVKELKGHPKADMVFGNEFLIDQKGERITGHGWFEFPRGSGAVCFPPATPLLNTVANNTIGAAFLYRAGTEAVLGGYSPFLYLLEDYDYFMRMNSLFRIRHIARRAPIYEYRMHPDSLTAHDGELKITASRPRLMEFDAYRQSQYKRPIPALFCGLPEGVEGRLQKNGFLPVAQGAKVGIFWSGMEVPHDGIWYQVSPLKKGGYQVTGSEGRGVFLAGEKDLGRFLRLRAICDLLRQEEEEFFKVPLYPDGKLCYTE